MSDYAQTFVSQVSRGAPLQAALQDTLQQETELRRLFAKMDSNNKVLNDHEPLAGLIDVFAANEAIRVTQARDASDQAKLEAEHVFPLKKEQRRSSGVPSMVADIDQFRNSWNVFTEGALSQLTDWNNVVAAGGSVLASLLPLPDHAKASKRALRKYFHEQTYSNSDVDLFLYDLTPEQAEKKAIQIYEAVRDSVPWDTVCVRTKHAISIHSQYPYRPVQIVLRLYKSPAEILAGFDIDCACFLYNGDRVFGNPRAIAAVMTQTNLVDMTRRSPSYEVRLAKYALRGFEVHVPNLAREDIDPTIFERSINRIEGLARLLVLEKLSDPVDRTKYLEKRREIRGRPQTQGYSRRAMRRRRKLVRGDLKAAAEQFGGLSASDYGTASFHIPYGPGFDAKKIEKFIYGTDLGMNSTFNPKNQDRRLHRHIAFFGTMEEVIKDCCEYCPDPLTPEEKDLQAEDDKMYIRGPIEFMQDDPGRQMMTGSFHPIDEGEWATQAYLGQVEKLFQAVANDDLETVVDIVEKGFDLKRRDHVGRTSLQLAIMARSEAVAKYLIDAGARITSRLVDGRTALHLAAQLGQPEIIDKLLERSKQNELRAERDKVEADAKAKAAAKQKQDADMSESPADEDEEMRPSSEDDWSSDEAASKRDKKAKPPKPTVNDPPAEGAAIPDDNDDLPDILDITAVDWDQNLSPLCHAIVAGHLSVVDTLIRAGADVQTPFKNGSHYHAMTTYPLTLTLLTEDKIAACAIAERLLEGGASCTAADETLKTVFHRATLSGFLSLVRTFLRVDPNAETAMSFLTQASWAAAFTPLASAVGLNDKAMFALLVAYGSKVTITEAMFDKSWDTRQNLTDNTNYKPPKGLGQWLKDTCMLVETSLSQTNDLALPLIELGADVNLALRNDYRNWYGTEEFEMKATILDRIREYIQKAEQNLRAYERITGGVPYKKTEPKVPPQVQGPDNSFLAWFTRLQERDAKLSAPRDEPGALPLKSWPPKEDTSIPWKALRQIVQVHLDWAREVEHAIVTQGGKTAKELNPKLLESETLNEAQATLFGMPQNTYFPLVQTTNPSDSASKQPSSPVTYAIFRSSYQTEPVATHLVESYAKLFEACWKGDVATIEMLCLPQKSGKRSKDITYLQVASQIAPTSLEPSGLFGFGTTQGYTTLAIAIFAKQWEAAKTILAIAEAQYEKPKEPKQAFLPFSPKVDDSDGEDSEMSVEDSDGEVPKPMLIDLASRLSTVKTPVSPSQLFSSSLFYDEKGSRSRTAILHSLAEADIPSLERALELGQMCEPKHTMLPTALNTILENDSPSMLEFVIRKYGYGLPSMEEEDEHEHQGGEATNSKKVSKIYLGLNVQGRKRKDLAQAGDPNAPSAYLNYFMPLMWRAAQYDARKILTWLTTPGPLQAYKAYMSQSTDEAALAMKRIPKFEEKLPSMLGATPNDLGENVLLAHLCSNEPKLETTILIFNLFPHMKKTFIHKRVKGLNITALQHVCGANLKPEIFDLFVARGSDVLVTGFKGTNILHALVWRGHFKLLKHVFTKLSRDQLATLLSQETKGKGNTPLMLAVKSGRYIFVDFLLAFDHPVTAASFSTRDAMGSLPIHYAVANGHRKILQSLLNTAAGVKTLFIENGVGTTPLEMAEFRYRLQVLQSGFKNQDVAPNAWTPYLPFLDPNIKYEANDKTANYELLKQILTAYPDTNRVTKEEVEGLEDIVESLEQEGRFIGHPEIKRVLEEYVQRTRAAAVKSEQISVARAEFKKWDDEMSPPPITSAPQDPDLIVDTQDIKGTYDLVRDAIRSSGTWKRRELVHLLDAQRAVNSALIAATVRKSPYGVNQFGQFGQGGTFDFKTNTYTTVAQKSDTSNEADEEKSKNYRYMLNFSSVSQD